MLEATHKYSNAALLSGSSGGSEEPQSDQGTESGHGASDERRSDEEKGASDAISEGDRSGSHRPQTPTQVTDDLISRYALAWELGQALDHLCKDKSAPVEDLEKMIAAARTAGLMESTLQAAIAKAEQRRESHADAPRNQNHSLAGESRCCLA